MVALASTIYILNSQVGAVSSGFSLFMSASVTEGYPFFKIFIWRGISSVLW